MWPSDLTDDRATGMWLRNLAQTSVCGVRTPATRMSGRNIWPRGVGLINIGQLFGCGRRIAATDVSIRKGPAAGCPP
jgi:hypothetical protein